MTVENSEKLAAALDRRGITHSVLNAKEHTREAEIIAQAGRLGSVTVATNMAGRGVDILLGGNPEGLARRDLLRDKVDADDPANTDAFMKLVERYEPECRAEGDQVRTLGGLYVLGTERHESRRIDNQLRGRSGRQGDLGESRFYLSLEDDLMRLFATGAVNWVMDRTLPDDVPLEAKMVTKAIERAQNTVEQKNAEVRKNVLKYDAVMNEQRKVIYARREQILGGDDLRAESLEYLRDATAAAVSDHCAGDVVREWDLDGLLATIRTFWPSELTAEELTGDGSRDWSPADVTELLCADGVARYEAREAEVGPTAMREVERQVLLRLVDQRWREHLADMDHLREGIHLRGIGQKDPVSEWQRRGLRHVRSHARAGLSRLRDLRHARAGHHRLQRRRQHCWTCSCVRRGAPRRRGDRQKRSLADHRCAVLGSGSGARGDRGRQRLGIRGVAGQCAPGPERSVAIEGGCRRSHRHRRQIG